MIRHEDVGLLEKMIRHRPSDEIKDIPALKEAIRDGLTEFEALLKPLSRHDREAAMSLFLERIRETALSFHLAILKLVSKNELQADPTPVKVRELGARCEQDMERIARLYRLL